MLKIAVKGPSGVNMVVLSYILYLTSETPQIPSNFERNKDQKVTRKVISFTLYQPNPNQSISLANFDIKFDKLTIL